AAANVGRLLQESRSLLGPEGAAGVGDVLTQTRWGLGWLLQAAATVVAALAFVRARGAREGSRAWGLAAVAAAALAFSPALTGHAAAMGRLAPVAIAADGFHVLGAGGWMGTLLLLALAGLPAARLAGERRGHFVAVMVGAFSPLALVFASVIALSGVASGAIHMGSLSNLWTTRYGRTLLLKVAAVGLVAAVGAYNWRRVLPDLPESAAADRLRRTSALELAASALVVLLTALLTGLEPGE
ncbi:MAG: CopD family protein, partial [Gemmatimonadaceae bacterium]